MDFVLHNQTGYAITGFLAGLDEKEVAFINIAPNKEIVIDSVMGDIVFSIHVINSSSEGSGMGVIYADGTYLVRGCGCLKVLKRVVDPDANKCLITVEPTE